MRIEKNTTDIHRTEAARPVHAAHAATPGSPVAPVAPAGGTDRVELSSEARALAARLDQPGEGRELTPERIAELRQRIRDGVYDTPDMAEEVARRVLDSGDL
ncbi:flagellar biosynthesis anti-sigma factor FlgM [Longimicrobium sp.]|uniref:flagellar biosynthesis anti-sigma factor FlgM n=1 Tax=Longimicrobium sp. TaxID=2029185 RepID=UPI002E37F5B8|nr:flagellar biosynthesis anti-sigma factor FlgM [Longimicrobium sp.]HEX6037815.1 flagellar biosynthesis anti-sigma factor FlgM [Longimicrobium sp.]